MTPADARTAAWLDRLMADPPPLGGAQAAVLRAVIAPAIRTAPAAETRAAAETAPNERTVNVTA